MKFPSKLGIALGLGAAATAAAVACLVHEDEESLRKKVVDNAQSKMGVTDPEEFWADVLTVPDRPRDWCAAFALWAMHKAGLVLDKKFKITLGFLLTQPYVLPVTTTPEIGDVAYFNKNQHHAIVSKVYPDGSVDLINGNGKDPVTGQTGIVAPSHKKKGEVDYFFSIKPYIDQKLAATV